MPRAHLVAVTLLCLAVTALAAADDSADYRAEVEAWRARRVARLTSETGWLTLTGLHRLADGGTHSDRDRSRTSCFPTPLGRASAPCTSRASR